MFAIQGGNHIHCHDCHEKFNRAISSPTKHATLLTNLQLRLKKWLLIYFQLTLLLQR